MIEIIGIICIFLFILYISVKMFKMQRQIFTEGFDSAGGTGNNASDFSKKVKSNASKIQDELLIPKYRVEYENVIINMEEYVNSLMLKTILKMNLEKPNLSDFEGLNTLHAAKESLNSVMKYVDEN